MKLDIEEINKNKKNALEWERLIPQTKYRKLWQDYQPQITNNK